MKLLAVSDQRLPEMQQQEYLRRNYSDVQMLISCGDMEVSYLEFISTVLNLPLYYVRGNHDERYKEQPPGGHDLHMHFHRYEGLRLVGLEGSMYYNGKNVQYTDVDMALHALRLLPRMLIMRWQHGYSVDYLVTHAPPRGIHDRRDKTHTGFRALRWLMRLARPRYLIHGHIDIWDRREVVETDYFNTRVININPKRLLLPEEDYLKNIRQTP